MEFNDNQPIYRQIVDYAFSCIISGNWKPGALTPSVRDLAATLGVNTRTVMKAFDDLQALRVIEPKRGMGFLLVPDACERVREALRNDFFSITVPKLREEMTRLGITPDQLIEQLKEQQ